MVFRWRDRNTCISCKFHRHVTFGPTDHGERSQEEIWTLIHHFPWTYALFVIERFRMPFSSQYELLYCTN